MSLIWFDQDCGSGRIGGKGFRLCRLTQAGFSVPAGFCVPVESMDSLSTDEIRCALERLEAGAVAVRSSALAEDSSAASFAGVYLTRLNVTTAEGVQQALADIRASARKEAAQAYRQRCGINELPEMAAVVQKFVLADASGVLFLRDPVDRSQRIIVEGAWGLGESVVAGAVTPDRWVLSPEGDVISSKVADKDIAIVAGEQGTKTTEVDSARRKVPCLNEGSLRELVALGRACEGLFGGPQDIEWAIESDRIWLLQSRPITCPV